MLGKIANPSGAYGQIGADFDEENNQQLVCDFEVSGAVAVADGDAIALVWDSTNMTLKCEPWDTDAAGQNARLGLGVSLDAGAAGDVVRVVVFGYAVVNVTAAATPAEGASVIGSTTKGQVAQAVAEDATLIAGTILGKFLGAEIGATNTAPIWVCP